MTVSHPEKSCEEEFDLFCAANSMASILNHFHQLCALAIGHPVQHPWEVYKTLRDRLKPYWKAAALFTKLEKKVQCTEYSHQSVCDGVNVIVIGCGPCGLRCAIELALLGAQVVVLEKRDTFSRNNVLHLWPYLIEDLRSLGAKTFFGKFCAGSIDHISIRTLQCILLKAALLFGVQIFPGVTFQKVIEPTTVPVSDRPPSCRVFHSSCGHSKPLNAPMINGHAGRMDSDKTIAPRVNGWKNKKDQQAHHPTAVLGWRVHLEPEVSVLRNFEVDILIGADGKRSCLGFPCKELRCRLAIAITANFVNHHTQAEAEVEEISGVASIFNQQFFARLASATGVDLENLVYYKDETHYFVMTAKKHSLLAKGVLKQDRDDSESLLRADNVDQRALQAYARETADFVTNGQIPRLDFALNSRGEPDVDAFDFTRIFAAEYSCRMLESKARLLMQCLIGDGLFEPFWPTGSGCALGFLSALDAAWAVKRLASGAPPLQVIAQRESVYQRLSQTTPQNMPPNFSEYTLDPRSRYTRCALNVFAPHQMVHLYKRDDSPEPGATRTVHVTPPNRLHTELCALRFEAHKNQSQHCTLLSHLSLLRWLQHCLSFYVCWGIVQCPMDLTPSTWESGHHLLCLIHLHRPELIPEIDRFFSNENASVPMDGGSIFRATNNNIKPSPCLIRACGMFIEYFDVIFSQTKEACKNVTPLESTFPRTTADWLRYLSMVQRGLSSMKMIEPRRPPAERMSSTCLATVSPRTSPTRFRKLTNGVCSPVRTPTSPAMAPRPINRVKGVYRENPKLTVEQGLMSKRRAELIATLHDPASAKRRTQVVPAIGIKKRPSSSNGPSSRSSSGSLQRSSSTAELRVVHANSNLEREVTVIKPVAIPPNVARLFAPSKSSSCCYICQKRLYLTERQTDFDLYFHRQCFRCAECGIQLQPGNATRVRAHGNQVIDKFYCFAHSPVSEPDISRVGRLLNNLCDASLMDRLRSQRFPFGTSTTPSECDRRLTTQDCFKPRPKLPSKLNPIPPYPGKSALLTGLTGNPDAVMGVSVVKAVIPSNRRNRAADSSSSPSPRPQNFRKSFVGPWGDSSNRSRRGIRDERAPSPGCYLAGHLGLPEMERRANWELNTSSSLLDVVLRNSSDGFRNNWHRTAAWDDCLASSESEEPAPPLPPNRPISRPRLPRQRKAPCMRRTQSNKIPVNRLSPSPRNFSSSSSSDDSTPPSTSFHHLYPFPITGYGLPKIQEPRAVSSPIHCYKLEAKQRFCMEPPKPVSIDPKQFISVKNRDRTTTSVLSDCSESLAEMDHPPVCHASVSSILTLSELSTTSSVTCEGLDSVMLSSREYHYSLRKEQLTRIANHAPDVCVSPSSAHPVFDNTLDGFRDIDSSSTVTDQSSTEQQCEPAMKSQPRTVSLKRASRASLSFLGDYDNVPSGPRSASVPLIDAPAFRRKTNCSEFCSSGSSSPDLLSVSTIRSKSRNPLIDSTHIPYSLQVQRQLALLDNSTKRSFSEHFNPIGSSHPPVQRSKAKFPDYSGLPPRHQPSVQSSPSACRRPSLTKTFQLYNSSSRTLAEGPRFTRTTHVFRIQPPNAPRSMSDSLLSSRLN